MVARPTGLSLGILMLVSLAGCSTIMSPIQNFKQQEDCRDQMIAATPESYLSNFAFFKTRDQERIDVYLTANSRPSFFGFRFNKDREYYHCVYTAGAATAADRSPPPSDKTLEPMKQ